MDARLFLFDNGLQILMISGAPTIGAALDKVLRSRSLAQTISGLLNVDAVALSNAYHNLPQDHKQEVHLATLSQFNSLRHTQDLTAAERRAWGEQRNAMFLKEDAPLPVINSKGFAWKGIEETKKEMGASPVTKTVPQSTHNRLKTQRALRVAHRKAVTSIG